VTQTRRRDAEQSRQALLDAATELFSERGFDRTTVRDIGEVAGVDPALIARYFGSKAKLYVETLRASTDAGVPDLLQPGRLGEVLDRVRRAGPGALLQAAVRSHDDPAVQQAAREVIASRLTSPLTARLRQASVPTPELRAELAIAAVAGIALGRASGAFDALGAASDTDVAALTEALLRALPAG